MSINFKDMAAFEAANLTARIARPLVVAKNERKEVTNAGHSAANEAPGAAHPDKHSTPQPSPPAQEPDAAAPVEDGWIECDGTMPLPSGTKIEYKWTGRGEEIFLATVITDSEFQCWSACTYYRIIKGEK